MVDTFWWSAFYFSVFRRGCLGCRNFYVGGGRSVAGWVWRFLEDFSLSYMEGFCGVFYGNIFRLFLREVF